MNITDRIKKQALIEDIYLAYKVHDWDKVDELYSQLLLKGFYDKTAEILHEGACRYRMVTQLSQKQETINKSWGGQIATNPLCGTIQIQEEQKSCVKDLISAIYDCETVTAETANEKFIDFNERVYDTYMSPMIKVIEGTELDCYNIAETKQKSFDEMSKDEKIEFVNKQIDDLLDFIERNKQAKYNQFKRSNI